MKKLFFTCFQIILISFVLFLGSSCKKETDQSAIDKELIEAYVLDNQLQGQSTDSGLYYVISVPGVGAHPTLSSTVTVTYHAYTLGGQTIDQGDFKTFKLANLIAGWQEGIPLIGEGGKIKLIVPSEAAYGDQVLVFDVALHYFTK